MQKTCPPQWLFGSGKRPPLSTPNSTPGPGNYHNKSTVGEGPRFSLRIRPNTSKDVMKNPGPGAYDATKTGQTRPKSPTWR